MKLIVEKNDKKRLKSSWYFAVNYSAVCVYLFILLLILLKHTTAIAQQKQKKVVMISLDGAPDYLVDKFLKSGVLPSNGAFAKMKKYGAYAETVLPVNVASTGPSHISIFTGASPRNTGIVGNAFRDVNQNWLSPNLTAFKQPIPLETVFQSAMRQGKKVIALGGVGLDYSAANRMTDRLYMYPINSGPSLVMDLIITDSLVEGQNHQWFKQLKIDSNSPSKAIFEITDIFKIPLHIYLADTAYSDSNFLRPIKKIIIDTDADLKNGYTSAVFSENWAEMSVKENGKQYNSSFTIFEEDNIKGKYRLFMSAPAEVFGYPSDFLEKIESKIGHWPGEPENRKQTTGLVSEKIWFEQIDRLAKYFKNLILTGMKEEKWDLLFGYFSTLDDIQHRYTLNVNRQLDYHADNGNRPKIYAGYIEKWFQTIDRYLLEIMNAAPEETNFVIFSDHGMIPIHTTLLLNNYFEEKTNAFSKAELKSVSSGNSAHIYINKEVIKPADYFNYINLLSKNLKSLKDPATGELIFKLVANQQEQKKYGLYNKDFSGDLFVSCKPGYTISDRLQTEVNYLVKNSFDPAMFANQNQPTKNFLLNGTMNETGRAVHGSLSAVRKGQSIFYSIGTNVPKKNLGKISSLQIAATISKLLEINPPKNAEGKNAF